MKIKLRKRKSIKKHSIKGGNNTTYGCKECPANNPTLSELSWNDRYFYGKPCASGWGRGGKRKRSKKFRLLI